jgi:hypothetical protein
MALSTEAATRKDSHGIDLTVLQHRHYKAIASIIRGMSQHARPAATAFAAALPANPRFDRQRFLTACGIED